MRYIRYVLKLIVALYITFILFAFNLSTSPEQFQTTKIQARQGMALQPPEFIKFAHATGLAQVDFAFILEEAGVTAYTRFNQHIEFAALESYFGTVRQQTEQFISGTIIAPGYENLTEFGKNAEVQAFVHRDGWIIAYLTKSQPASLLIDWVNYDQRRLQSTLIESVVRLLALNVGATDFNISYYDFRYPKATSLILVGERVDDVVSNDSFEINVPLEFTIYEKSWSHAKLHSYSSPESEPLEGTCKLNDEILSVLKPLGWGLRTGEFTQAEFPLGIDHILKVSGGNTRSYCGIAIVYQEMDVPFR